MQSKVDEFIAEQRAIAARSQKRQEEFVRFQEESRRVHQEIRAQLAENRRSQERILALLVQLVTNNSSGLTVQATSPVFDTAPLPVANSSLPLASASTVEPRAPQPYDDSGSLSANASPSELSDSTLSEPVTDFADDETADGYKVLPLLPYKQPTIDCSVHGDHDIC
jgi:hypothetical protein